MPELQYFSRLQIGTFNYWLEGTLIKKITQYLEEEKLPGVTFLTQPKIRHGQWEMNIANFFPPSVDI